MTSELKVDKITPASGTNTQIGEAGDTTNLSAGTVTLPTTIITGQSAKTSLADADKFLISDSAASGAFKYVESQYIGGGTLVQTAKVFYETSQSTDNVTLTNAFTDDYDHYVMFAALCPASNGAGLYLRFKNDSGTQISSSNYDYASSAYMSDGNTTASVAQSADKTILVDGLSSNPTDSPFVGTFWFNINKNHSVPGQMASFNCHGQYLARESNSNRRVRSYHHASAYRDSMTNNEARDIKLYLSSGNFEQANVRMYGIKESNS